MLLMVMVMVMVITLVATLVVAMMKQLWRQRFTGRLLVALRPPQVSSCGGVYGRDLGLGVLQI